MKRLIVILLLFIINSVHAQIDTTKYLLLDAKVQYESTEAINALYNFKFDIAEKRFNWMIQEYPEHPLPYYLMGLSAWWKIMPNDAVKDYDEAFFKYMELSIEKAEKLYKNNPNNREAKFFLASAYGLKARFHSDRNSYTKAAFATKKALGFLNKVEVGNDELDPEFLLGDALYNYFREWIPENKPGLKPIVMFFSKGNKALGILQLKKVSNESFYTRIEAMNFMILIYEYEKTPYLAIPIAKYLHETFPDNAYFHYKYAKLSFQANDPRKTKVICEEFLRKFHAKYPGYEAVGARYSSYFIAEALLETASIVESKNKRIDQANDKTKSKNKSKLNDSISITDYNEKVAKYNNSILKYNFSVNAQNHFINEGEMDKSVAWYNKSVNQDNSKIDKQNKLVSRYNSKIDKTKNKMKFIYSKKYLQGSVLDKIEYTNDSTDYYLKQTIMFGKQLDYEDKNYHINSLHYLALMAIDKKDKSTAIKYYEELLRVAPKKHFLRRVAKTYIKNQDAY